MTWRPACDPSGTPRFEAPLYKAKLTSAVEHAIDQREGFWEKLDDEHESLKASRTALSAVLDS